MLTGGVKKARRNELHVPAWAEGQRTHTVGRKLKSTVRPGLQRTTTAAAADDPTAPGAKKPRSHEEPRRGGGSEGGT